MIVISTKKFLRLCLSPETAYDKKYSDCIFFGMALPCVAYVLFALNVALERASCVPSYGFIKIMLLSFIGLAVGAFTVGLIAAAGLALGIITKKKTNGLQLLGCVEYSFFIAVLTEFIGLIMRICGANISSVFGILGIFSAVATVFVILRTIFCENNFTYAAVCTAAGVIVMLGMNIIFFVNI